MSEFKVGDRVITTTDHPTPGPGLAGRVVSLWGRGYPRVRLEVHWKPRGTSWSMYDNELTLAPSRRAEVGIDDAPEVHCYCAKESPLSSYTSSEGHYQEEAE